jgi:hypothetical protein
LLPVETKFTRVSFPIWAVAIMIGGLVVAKLCVVIYQMRKMRARLNLATTEEGLRRRGDVERGGDSTSASVLARRGDGSEMRTRQGADSALVFDNRPASATVSASFGTHRPASRAEADASTRDSSHGRVTWPIAPADATAPDIAILPRASAPSDDQGQDGATPSDVGPFTAGGAATYGGGGSDAHPPESVPPAAFAARVAAGGEGIVWPGFNLDDQSAAAAAAGGAAVDDTRPKEATGDELWGESGRSGGGQTTNPVEGGAGAGGASGRAAAGGGRESTGARHGGAGGGRESTGAMHGGAAATTDAQEAHPP